ncbi:14048_t:CDS:1, partial [Funneliformis geosporum]
MEELLTSLKKAQELQKKLDQGNMDSMFNILNQDPQLKKQMEELRKKMG